MYAKLTLPLQLKLPLLSFTMLLFLIPAFAQQVNNLNPGKQIKNIIKKEISNTTTNPSGIEICDNNIDDDTNALTDMKDFYCYFNPSITGRCVSTKIIWACGDSKLMWIDLDTRVEHFIGNMDGRNMLDIAWGANGKLYGVEGVRIFEIDPNTSQTTYVTFVAGYSLANSMTADAFGNLYIAAFSGNRSELVKINLATLQQTLIVNLSDAGLVPGGDLTYYDGALYLICDSYEIAKINIAPISVQVTKLINSPVVRSFGITNIGDGFLYFSHENKLYKLDPASMVVEPAPVYSFVYTFFSINGLCSYSESCFSKDCKANVSIAVNASTPQPYCSEYGVELSAMGSGINGQSNYLWTLPNGSTVPGPKLFVTQSGKYHVSYHTVPDICGREDSVTLKFISGCEEKLFVPAAFTPNADGLNDFFKPSLLRLTDFYEMEIYNRYGQPVFRSNTVNAGWDGTYFKKAQGFGSYVWILRYRFKGMQSIQHQSGSVLLMR